MHTHAPDARTATRGIAEAIPTRQSNDPPIRGVNLLDHPDKPVWGGLDRVLFIFVGAPFDVPM